MTFQGDFPSDSHIPKALREAFEEVWNKGKEAGAEEYKQKVRDAIDNKRTELGKYAPSTGAVTLSILREIEKELGI